MTEQPVNETPVIPPPLSSTAEHVRREEAELAGEARPDAPVVEQVEKVAEAVVTVTPEQEAASLKPDSDLSEAGRALRKGRMSERIARVEDENKALAEQLRIRKQLRDELGQFAPAPSPTADGVSAGTTTTAGAPAGFTDPADPEPDPKAYPAEEYDPAYIRAVAKWEARAEHRRQTAVMRERVEQQMAGQVLADKETAARAKYSDFDAVTDPLVEQFRGNPRGPAILDFVRESSVGAEVAYALGKDDSARQEIAAASSPVGVLRVLTRVEAALLESARQPTPKPITSAPAPPSKTVGGGASAATDARANSTSDHYRREQAEIAERQKRGYRE